MRTILVFSSRNLNNMESIMDKPVELTAKELELVSGGWGGFSYSYTKVVLAGIGNHNGNGNSTQNGNGNGITVTL